MEREGCRQASLTYSQAYGFIIIKKLKAGLGKQSSWTVSTAQALKADFGFRTHVKPGVVVCAFDKPLAVCHGVCGDRQVLETWPLTY